MLDFDFNKCVGCQQCQNTCPKHAIDFVIKNGFIYPQIDDKKCISCGLCENSCPVLNKSERDNFRPEVYAAWSKDEVQRLDSTSGGICYELSRYFIENGGYVAGVSWTKDFKHAEYEIINDYEGLKRITHSKYFQPRANSVYMRVKDLLDRGYKVLFIGTACYGEALRLYLKKDYHNLVCCDFICRGYTSQIFHEKRLIDLEQKYGSTITGVHYKNKLKGWRNFGTYFEFENGESYYVNRYDDPYEIMFQVDDYNTRPSCFECKYRTEVRKSDITVGDFWGIKRVEEENYKKGISAVLINSYKGKEIFEKIKENIIFEKRDIYEVQAGNLALRHNLVRNDKSEKFFEDMEKHSMDYIYKKYASKKRKGIVTAFWEKVKDLFKCDLFLFVKYNWFSSVVIRKKGRYLIPYKGTKIRFAQNAKLVLNENLFLNTQKHGHTREEMYFTVGNNAEVKINGRTTIATGSTVDILDNAFLSTGKVDTNIGVVLVCSNVIEIGDDVQIGRGVMIYDSNYHKTGFNNQTKLRPLRIGNHVWLCTGVTITKGVKIGNGAICGINSTIMSNVKERTMVMGNPAKVIMTDVEW